MVRRILLSVLLLVSVSPYALALDAKTAYYGREVFGSNLQGIAPGPAGKPLKEVLYLVLSGSHTTVPGDYDKIANDCWPGGGNCYRHTAIGYTRARQFLFGEFYLVRSGQNYGVKDVYCQRVADSSEFPGDKPGPNQIPDHRTMNAEHTWPQSQFSRGFPGEDQKSDVHHLYPTDSEMNSRRSSWAFGEVESNDEPLKCSGARLGLPRSREARVFEPPTVHKGNVARSLFYFATRYKMDIPAEEEATLREWHRQDPVDAEEMARNERIFQLQKNRNPFVDFPQLADRIRDF